MERVDITADWKRFDALLLRSSKQDEMEIGFRERFDRPLEFYAALHRYAELYSKIDFNEIGHLLFCNRDKCCCAGFNSNIKLTQSQNKMLGMNHCYFRYSYEFIHE